MKLCFIYVFGDIFRNKKQNIALFLAVVLAITMVSVAAISMESKKASDVYFISKLAGNYLLSGQNLSREAAATVMSDPALGEFEFYRFIDIGKAVLNTKLSDASSKIFKAAENLITEGRAPEKGEILVCKRYKNFLKGDLSDGDYIEIQIGSSDSEEFSEPEGFIVSGIYETDDNWIWSMGLDAVIVATEDFARLMNKYPEAEMYTIFSYTPKADISEIIRKYQNQEIYLSNNATYIMALQGTILFMPFMLIFVCVFVAGSAIIICMNQVAIKKQAKNFAILSMVGCGDGVFNKIVFIKTFLTAVLCIPVSIIIASVLLYFILGNDPEFFILTISPFTVAIICLLSAIIIYISTYIPLILSQRKKHYELYGSAKTSQIKKSGKINFSPWYLRRFLTAEKPRVTMLIISATVCFAGIMFLFYIFSLNTEEKSMFGEMMQLSLRKYEGENADFQKSTYEEILKFEECRNVLREARYYNTFGTHTHDEDEEEHEDSEITMMYLNNKKVFDELKKSVYQFENGKYIMRAEFIYNDMPIFEHARDYVVEGDFECIYNETGKVIVIDNNWAPNNPDSFHVGDKIVFEKMAFDEKNISYTQTGNEKVTLTVGAVIKNKHSKYYGTISGFPVYVSLQDYEELTGTNAMTTLYVYSNDPLDSDSITVLKNEIAGLQSSEKFTISDQYENNIWTYKLKTVFNMIVVVLNVFIIISICFILWLFNYYYIEKRKDELNILFKIGVPRKKLFSMFLSEGVVYGAISTVAAVVAGYIISFIMYTMIKFNPILYPWEFPVIIIIGCGSLCLAVNIISIIVPMYMLHRRISGIKNGGKINV